MSALKTVDDLLWSLKIPDHPQSRQRLITFLPGLLQRVRVGMEVVALPAAEQQRVLDELMTIHTEALRPGRALAGAAGALTPEEIVQRMRDEVVAEVGAGAQLQRFGDRPLVDGDRSRRAPAERRRRRAATTIRPARRGAARRRPPARLPAGRWSRVQLLWRSDRGLFFLFAASRRRAPHPSRGAPSSGSLGRAGPAARNQAAGAARRRPHDARHLPARLTRARRSARERALDLGGDERRPLVDDPVRGAGDADDRADRARTPPGRRAAAPAGRGRPRPRSRASAPATVTVAGAKLDRHDRIVGAGRRAQRRGAVVVAAAAQASRQTRDSARALLGEPAAAFARRVGGAHAREERPEAREVVLGSAAPRRRGGTGIHVRAGRLLRRVVRSSRRKVAGCGELMITRRRIASGAAPRGPRRARRPSRARPARRRAAERVDQRRDVGDEVLGAIGLDSAGADERS